MKVVDIAKLCHETNRAYCISIGDVSQRPWSESPLWQQESAVNGVEFHLTNDTTPKESHNNWMKEKIADGWQYGIIKDPENKLHPCITPYELLPQEQKSKDYIFKAICDFFKESV